ncbi:hypothetical protein CQ14_08565 [Bradyrhizobium lablabi]|uniref:O-antigen ligase-related domain-containing protein n=1 Tax=Bradyrhizobium lablabi TaxID=722472 RepID=A0A0R3N5Z2_9BRAD|nr:O-antigen ligase family protein [Bradyrhizobium lablabi]KRR27881.1 hypothetical protein CQ14_08565 [Bradyrhizobium lablabi]
MTANWFATVVIFAWPAVSFALYRTRPFSEATLWTILGALLLLPSNVSVKLEMIPAFDKNTIPNLCVAVACFALAQRQRVVRPHLGVAEILAVAWIVGPVFTSVLNGDTLVYGPTILPGVGYYDGISALLGQLLLCLPFFVGRVALQRSADTEAILRVLLIAGLLYSVLMLFEIRMSPVLSSWVYDYFPSGFVSEMRYGGFRPVVFMKNGLAAAFFIMTAFLAAVAFWRLKTGIIRSFPPAGVSAYLAVVIILCKSAGALIYAGCIGFFVRWSKPKTQVRIAVVIVTIGIFYPVLRMTNYFPTSALLETAMVFNRERAESLQVRFDQEQQLLAHASQRFLFGWGRYGRNRVYEENFGKDISITDGAWIQVLGQFGIIGFAAQFGLLALPVFRAMSAFRFVGSARDRVSLAVLALIVALNLIEQIPNSSMSSWNWLLAGALLGRAEYLKAVASSPRKPVGAAGFGGQSLRSGE